MKLYILTLALALSACAVQPTQHFKNVSPGLKIISNDPRVPSIDIPSTQVDVYFTPGYIEKSND